MDNKFGKISRISACAALKDGKTILEDLSFTAPYKIMTPFEKENGGIQIMPLCASAGIMAGDSQEFSYHVKEGADLEVLSQSFEKIHKMDEGSAARTIEVQVDKNATLYYYPQPVIPFAQSAFDSKMTIHLEDETSRLPEEELFVARLLAPLPEPEREIVVLHVLGGLRLTEIARTMGIPSSTARWRYANARKRLKKELDDAARLEKKPARS